MKLIQVEVLDSTIARALKKLLTAVFNRRFHKEEPKSQHDNRFLKGRHISFMIDDNFKISGTREALLDFNDQIRVQLKNDNAQGFDTNWDEVVPFPTKVPDEDKLEILYMKGASFLRGIETFHGFVSAVYD